MLITKPRPNPNRPRGRLPELSKSGNCQNWRAEKIAGHALTDTAFRFLKLQSPRSFVVVIRLDLNEASSCNVPALCSLFLFSVQPWVARARWRRHPVERSRPPSPRRRSHLPGDSHLPGNNRLTGASHLQPQPAAPDRRRPRRLLAKADAPSPAGNKPASRSRRCNSGEPLSSRQGRRWNPFARIPR
jgi:hypothetical protein